MPKKLLECFLTAYSEILGYCQYARTQGHCNLQRVWGVCVNILMKYKALIGRQFKAKNVSKKVTKLREKYFQFQTIVSLTAGHV